MLQPTAEYHMPRMEKSTRSSVAIICKPCGRRGVLNVAGLLARQGLDLPLTVLINILSADCPGRREHTPRCSTVFEDLPKQRSFVEAISDHVGSVILTPGCSPFTNSIPAARNTRCNDFSAMAEMGSYESRASMRTIALVFKFDRLASPLMDHLRSRRAAFTWPQVRVTVPSSAERRDRACSPYRVIGASIR